MIELSANEVRQLAIEASKLATTNGRDSVRDIVQQIRCVQIDPIRAVERTQLLTLWSRLGEFDPERLGALTYDDKFLMEYWAHAASFVLSEDMALHQYLMRERRADKKRKFAQWVEANKKFRDYILDVVRGEGPVSIHDFEDRTNVPMSGSGGWNGNRHVGLMVDHLWTIGEIAVADRDGNKRSWDLFERHYDRVDEIEDVAVCERAVVLALRGLGIATARQIKKHFTRGRYPELKTALATLTESGTIEACYVPELNDDVWYRLPSTNVPEATRTTVLSPFDNLICDRDRTELLWDFYFRIEIYVPKEKREFGYYVLPILHHNQLVGRIDSAMNRKTNVYEVAAIFIEKGFKPHEESGLELLENLKSLARFLGAERIQFSRRKPAKWRSILVSQNV